MPIRYTFWDSDRCRRVGNAHYAIYLRQRCLAIDHANAHRYEQARLAGNRARVAEADARASWDCSLAGGVWTSWYFTRWGR